MKIVKNEADIIKFGFPSVLKSSNGDSSKEVVMINSKKDLKSFSVYKLLKSGLKLFVEKKINGVEETDYVNDIVLLEKLLPTYINL